MEEEQPEGGQQSIVEHVTRHSSRNAPLETRCGQQEHLKVLHQSSQSGEVAP